VTDREKVIKGLEICSAGEWNSTGGRDHTACPYYPAGYTGCTCKLLMRDALAMLKEQEHKDRMYRALEDDWKRLKELLKEQEEQIRQLTEELEELRKKRNEVYYSGYDGSFIL
jgi:hypothetical protein